jgi:hypothetical protein
LSQQINDLHTEYDKYQKQVVQDAIQVAATYAAVLHRAADDIGHLDVLVALAQTAAYSTTGPYCRPVLTDCDDNGRHENGDPKVGIILQQARHPCVELQESIDFIPNDYNLIFDESSFLIVTGPNSTWWLPFEVVAHVPLLYLYSLFFICCSVSSNSGWQIDLHSCRWSHCHHGTNRFVRTMYVGDH